MNPAGSGVRLAGRLAQAAARAATTPVRMFVRRGGEADEDSGGFLHRGDWAERARETFVFSFPGGPSAPGAARSALEAPLARSLDEQRCEDALVLLSELVMNSVVHAGASRSRPVEVELGIADRRVRVEVLDRGPGFDPAAAPRRGGFGMVLLDRMTDRWGASRGRSRTCVWFELSRPDRGKAPVRRRRSGAAGG